VKRFVAKHADKIEGVLNGFDRLVLRGSLRTVAYARGMMRLLWDRQVLLKDFKGFAASATEQLKRATQERLEELGRPLRYLPSSQTDKESAALEIAQRDGITQGLVCVLSCVEPCWAFDVYRNASTKQLDLVMRQRKCLAYYHYAIDPVFGWMNARIQSWLPFNVQVCLNGREWLSRQMDREGLAYRRADNCFTWIHDFGRAQSVMDEQLRTNWPTQLDRIAATLGPVTDEILWRPGRPPLDYYWSVYQSEWASDVAFRDPAALAATYAPLVLHGITSFSSADVMRFLGSKFHGRFQGEVVSDFKVRQEGVRIKHRAGENSIKLYDKQGSVLRAETTLNDAHNYRVFRTAEGDDDGKKSWRPVRKGVADLYRRTQVSQEANERYLDAFADVDTSTPLKSLLDEVCKPTTWKGKRVRGLRPFVDDTELLRTICRGEYALNGLRNRDIQDQLFSAPSRSKAERRSRSARVTRQIRLLRAHGLLHKVAGTHRYKLAPRGRELAVAILAAQRLTLGQINKLAA